MSSYPILLVEDRDSLRTMLRHALEAHSHTVLEARDEAEAIEQLGKTRPVVVLTDLKLPVGDGFGVLRAAKELDPDLPVVVMTAYGSIQDAVTAMKDGALDFLAKPIEPDHLLLMVERAIAHHRRRREAPAGLAAAASSGRHGIHGAPRRRERHREGVVRPCAARAEPAR